MGTNGFNTEQEEELTIDHRPVIFTTDEEGQNHQFQMVDMIEVDDKTYALLLYLGQDEDKAMVDENDEEAEMVVMRVVQEGDEQVFEMLEDDDEYERVLQYLESIEEDDDEDDEAPPASQDAPAAEGHHHHNHEGPCNH